MNFEQFKQDALRTESRPEKLGINDVALFHALMAASQFTEFMDHLKKCMFYGKPVDTDKLALFTLYTTGQMHYALAMLQQPHRAHHFNDLGGSPNLRVLHGALGMFTEAGELLQAVLKQLATGELDMVNVAEETGDSDWYKAIIHDETGITEDTVREKVIAKLKARYGEKFSSEAAINRDLAAERKVLEA